MPEEKESGEQVLADVDKVLCLVKGKAQGDADLDVAHRVLKVMTKNLHPPHAAMMTNKPQVMRFLSTGSTLMNCIQAAQHTRP